MSVWVREDKAEIEKIIPRMVTMKANFFRIAVIVI